MKKTAFTLVELMVTVAIIAIITAVAVTSYQGYSIKGRWSDVQPCISDTALRLENYRTNHGLYPTDDHWNAINSSSDCGNYYEGTIVDLNGGSNYLVYYVDTKSQIGPSGWDHDGWAVIDTGMNIYHVSNPLDPEDVDTLPEPYNSNLPSFSSP